MNIYDGDYRKLMILPILLILVGLFFIPSVQLGIDFQGGTIIRLYTPDEANIDDLKANLIENGLNIRKVQQIQTQIQNVVEIELDQDDKLSAAEDLRGIFYTYFDDYVYLESIVTDPTISDANLEKQQALEEYNEISPFVLDSANQMFEIADYTPDYTEANEMKSDFDAAYNSVKKDYQERVSSSINIEYDSISVKTVSPTLGVKFIERALSAILWALLLSVILAFAVFRKIATSIIVFIGAFADVVITLGAMGLFGIPLTLPSFAALLMMLGFSLNTDMLLTMRLIKQRKGTLRDASWSALKTGTTMSTTDLIAFSSLLILGHLTHLTTYSQIASIAVIGLVGDLIATWMLSAPLIMVLLKER
ncbi:hypothetical protein KO465_03870 [Candidatus Micrarchaeota archaeon]|nr:hypothetical protein [Candidatus Micrarchaeota archaeon]